MSKDPGVIDASSSAVDMELQDLEKLDYIDSQPDKHADGHLPSKSADAVITSQDPHDGDNDPENPMNWQPKHKWLMLILISVMTFITPLASSMFAPGIEGVENDLDFHSSVIGGFVVSVYVLGYVVGPLVVAPCSELYGRTVV
jgi:hypothetical protein